MQQLRQYIKHISPLTTDLELDYILTKFEVNIIAKDTFLVKGKQTCKTLSIVKQGCFKIFYTDADNNDVNAWFAFEQMPCTEMYSFISQQPSQYSVQAMEDAEVYSINYTDVQELYNQFNSFQKFGLRLTEQILVKTIDRLTSFQFETAEQRYEKIINDTNYTQRIPLKDLASFIGVTPNSLSRLRSGIAKK
jgi:CRP/FNR family transcriptional regulator, anaerobic regulatory protein